MLQKAKRDALAVRVRCREVRQGLVKRQGADVEDFAFGFFYFREWFSFVWVDAFSFPLLHDFDSSARVALPEVIPQSRLCGIHKGACVFVQFRQFEDILVCQRADAGRLEVRSEAEARCVDGHRNLAQTDAAFVAQVQPSIDLRLPLNHGELSLRVFSGREYRIGEVDILTVGYVLIGSKVVPVVLDDYRWVGYQVYRELLRQRLDGCASAKRSELFHRFGDCDLRASLATWGRDFVIDDELAQAVS